MENMNLILNKFLRFSLEVLKGRYGLSSEAGTAGVVFSDEESTIIKRAAGQVLSTAQIEAVGNFGLGGEDCNSPLELVFKEVSLTKPHTLANTFIYPVLDGIPYPQSFDQNKPVITDGLRQSFLMDYNAILRADGFESNEVLLVFLEKYGGLIPVNNESNSVSFYDYVKTLSAVLPASDSSQTYNEEAFALIGGDLSGIQNFIFSISSRGALKSYRARSFYLEMLVQHMVDEVVSQFGLNETNVVYSSGGTFLIVAPDAADIDEKVRQIRNHINKWLFSKFRGLIYFSLEYTKLSDFTSSMESLSNKLENSKLQKYSDFIGEILVAKEPVQKTNDDECQICYTDLDADVTFISGDIRGCRTCRELFNVGKALANARYIVRTNGSLQPNAAYFEIANKTYFITANLSPNLKGDVEKVWIVNSFDINEYLKFKDYKPSKLLLGNYVTKISDLEALPKAKEYESAMEENEITTLDENDTATFLGLAYSSIGLKKIAVLRMDVDNLGSIFSIGLREPSLVKIASLSRFLDYYFKYYLNWICKGQSAALGDEPLSLIPERTLSGRHVSVIFSGGDDLLIVGPWNEIVELSYDIHRTFERFVCKNPDITISGSFLVSDYNFPLNSTQMETKRALDFAKSNYESCEFGACRNDYSYCVFYSRGRCSAKKNSVTLFYDPSLVKLKVQNDDLQLSAKWSKAEEIESFVKQVVNDFGGLKEETNSVSLEGLPRLLFTKLIQIFLSWARNEDVYVIPLIRLMNDTERELQRDERKLALFVQGLKPQLVKRYFSSDICVGYVPLMWIDFLTRSVGD